MQDFGGDARSAPPPPPPLSALLPPCLAVLSLAALAHLVAPRIGGFLLCQLAKAEEGATTLSSRLLKRSGEHRRSRWDWKTATECFSTSVMFGLCITAAVLSGGWPGGLGRTRSCRLSERDCREYTRYLHVCLCRGTVELRVLTSLLAVFRHSASSNVGLGSRSRKPGQDSCPVAVSYTRVYAVNHYVRCNPPAVEKKMSVKRCQG